MMVVFNSATFTVSPELAPVNQQQPALPPQPEIGPTQSPAPVTRKTGSDKAAAREQRLRASDSSER